MYQDALVEESVARTRRERPRSVLRASFICLALDVHY